MKVKIRYRTKRRFPSSSNVLPLVRSGKVYEFADQDAEELIKQGLAWRFHGTAPAINMTWLEKFRGQNV